MIRLEVFLVGVLLPVLACGQNGHTQTSVHRLVHTFRLEKKLIAELTGLAVEGNATDFLKGIPTDEAEAIGNPVHVYNMMKRFRRHWTQVLEMKLQEKQRGKLTCILLMWIRGRNERKARLISKQMLIQFLS